LYAFPGAYAPGPQAYPVGWGEIPGAAGCTLEARTYAAHHDAFTAAGARVLGVSTQRLDQLGAFRDHARLPFDLLSDQDGRLAVSLRLPTFLVAGALRLKRVTLFLEPGGTVAAVQSPIPDPAGAVQDMLAEVRSRATLMPGAATPPPPSPGM
jgi:peroxiredoxin